MSPLVCLLDVETTGMEDDAQVVEIAAVTGRFFERGAQVERTIKKVAYAEFEDAPSYGLQALRYWLGTAGPPFGSGGHAHRAMYDVWTLLGVFDDLRSRGWNRERMIEVSSRPRLLRTILFGKHKGAKFADLDRSYLDWMRTKRSEWDEDVQYTLDVLKQQAGAR